MERSTENAIWSWVFGDPNRPKPGWPNTDGADGLNGGLEVNEAWRLRTLEHDLTLDSHVARQGMI